MLWLASLALLWVRRPARAVSAARSVPQSPPQTAPRDLIHASDVRQQSAALLGLLRRERPGVRSLDDAVAQLDDARQVNALRALERALYHDGSAEDAMRQVREAFARGVRWRVAARSAEREAVLPPLYPERRPR
jgi:hypothetical protein